MAAVKPIPFDVQRLIDEVAARHRLLLKPDDAAFAIVTMNRLVLEESLEAIHSRIVEDLALFEAAAKKMQTRAGTVLLQRRSASPPPEFDRSLSEMFRTLGCKHQKLFDRSRRHASNACPRSRLQSRPLPPCCCSLSECGRDGSARCGGPYKQRK